jgi:hypothetical protein
MDRRNRACAFARIWRYFNRLSQKIRDFHKSVVDFVVLVLFSYGMTNTAHSFPKPWTVSRTTGGYSILDANSRAVAFVYFVEGFREAVNGQPLSAREQEQVAEALLAVSGSQGQLIEQSLRALSEAA